MSESRPRILVFAYNEVGYDCLSELLDRGANVVGVFTYRDDPAEEIWFSSVERLALESDLDVFTPPDVDDSARRIIRDLAPDLILSGNSVAARLAAMDTAGIERLPSGRDWWKAD